MKTRSEAKQPASNSQVTAAVAGVNKAAEAAQDAQRAAATLFQASDALVRDITWRRGRTRDLAPANANLSAAEWQERKAQIVSVEADRWIEMHGRHVVFGESGMVVVKPLRGFALMSHPHLNDFGAYCAGAPDLAMSMLDNIVARAGYVPGQSTEEREAEMKRLAAEIVQLEAEHEQLVDEAIAGGIMLQHRPDVIRRRESEARRRQLDRDRQVPLQEAMSQIDQRERKTTAVDLDAVPRTGPSSYLAGGKV